MPLGTSPPHTLDKGDYYYSLPSPRRRPPPVPPADLIPSIGRQTCLSTCPAGANKNRQQEGLLGLFFQFTRWAAQESKTSRQAPRSRCSCRACARVCVRTSGAGVRSRTLRPGFHREVVDCRLLQSSGGWRFARRLLACGASRWEWYKVNRSFFSFKVNSSFLLRTLSGCFFCPSYLLPHSQHFTRPIQK